MPSHDMVLDSIEGSNIPAREKSSIRRWVEGTLGKASRGYGKVKGHMHQTAQVVRGGGEALVTGGVLGAIHAEAEHGLDMGGGKVPLDGVVGVLGLGGAIAAGDHEAATDLRNTGMVGVGILSFRKTHDWMAEKKLARGEVPGSSNKPKSAGMLKAHGDDMGDEDIGADPIEQAAREV